VVDALPELAPVAEQERLKVLLPPTPMVIDSEPVVPLEPDQAPDAEQLVARVDDQVRVMEELTSAESAEEVRETVMFCGAGAEGSDPPPPPPPLPPQPFSLSLPISEITTCGEQSIR